MASNNPQFTPYVSEFEFASRFHPSINPDCPGGSSSYGRENEMNRRNFEFSRLGRSLEEDPPVGQEPSIEVRAILVRCPKTEDETDDIIISRNIFNITAGRSQDILDFHGFDRDEPIRHSEVRDCRRKLVITMKFNNHGRTKTQEEFVVIDHVLDPVTMHKARLLNPFVVKVRQEPVLQLYGLKFQGSIKTFRVGNIAARIRWFSSTKDKPDNYRTPRDIQVVNAEASEEVINNKQSNYTGCDDTSENPTCGQMFFQDNPVPYSEGFCCSCDPEVNVQRENSNMTESVASSSPSFFANIRERPMRPFKSSRSVKTNSPDPNPKDIGELSLSGDAAWQSHMVPSEHTSLDEVKNANFSRIFEPMEGHENLYDVEKDLISLKNLTKITDKSNRLSTGTNLNAIEYKNESLLPATSSIGSGIFGQIQNKPKNDVDSTKTEGQGPTAEIPENGKVSKRKYSLNIIDELSKLEKDYKDLRVSRMASKAGKNEGIKGEPKPKLRRMNSGNVKYSRERMSADDARFFVKNQDYDRKLITSSSAARGVPSPISKMIHDDGPTLNVIDVKLAFRPREKSTTCGVNLTVASSKTCLSKILQSVATTIPSFSESGTSVAVLWQKIASDRVYPDEAKKNHVLPRTHGKSGRTNFHPTIKMDNRETAFNIAKLSRWEIENGPIAKTTMSSKQHDRKVFPVRNHELSSRARNFQDSSPIGNNARNGAIVLSGSLRNQLNNFMTYEQHKRKDRTTGGRKKKRRKYDENIQVGNKLDMGRKKLYLPKIAPRSYRSVAENDLFVRDNDRQRSIDDRIEVEFEKISDVLREAAEDPKVIGAGSKSDEIFENDDSIVKKFQSIVQAIPANIAPQSDPEKHDTFLETQAIHVPKVNHYLNKDIRLNKANGEDQLSDRSNSSVPITEMTEKVHFPFTNQVSTTIKSHTVETFVEFTSEVAQTADNPANSDPSKQTTDLTHLPEERDNTLQTEISLSGTSNPSIESRNRVKKVYTTTIIEPSTIIMNVTLNEPISEIPLTTHQIHIDKFKIPNEYHAVPSESSSSGTTNPPTESRIKKLYTSAIVESSTIVKNVTPNEPISEMPLTTRHRIFIDRFKILNEYHDLPTTLKSVRQNNSKSHSNQSKIPTNRDPKQKGTLNSHLLSRVPSEILTNLKKQLLNDAAPNFGFPRFRDIADSLETPEKYPRFENDVREVYTELTPAERVEDSITEEETLPPEEETNSTTASMSKTTTNSFPVATDFPLDPLSPKSAESPRFFLPQFHVNSLVKDQAMTSEKTYRTALPLDKPSSPHGAFLRGYRRKKGRKARIYTRRHQRSNRSKKLPRKRKKSIGQMVVNEKDENARYESSAVNELTTVSKDPGEGRTTKSLFRITPDAGISNLGGSTVEIYSQVNESPEKKWHDRTDLNFNTQTPPSPDSSHANFNFPLAVGSSNNKTVGNATFFTKDKTTMDTTPHSQKLITRKFPSFYPKSSDIIAKSRNENGLGNEPEIRQRNVKRNDAFGLIENENERKVLTYYDYEPGEDRIPDEPSVEDKRSLHNVVPEEAIDGIEPSDNWKEKMELLKLKKHADVLKEYLNWRHDVEPSEQQKITNQDYTTRIIMTELTTDDGRTTLFHSFRTRPVGSLPDRLSQKIFSHFGPVKDENPQVLAITNQRTEVGDKTTISNNVKSSTITTSTTQNIDAMKTTKKIILPPGCANDYQRQEPMNTGKILPPCCAGAESSGVEHQPTNGPCPNARPHISPGSVPDNIENLNNRNNDLVIISVLEKSRVGKKHNLDRKGKMYKIREESKPVRAHGYRRHRSKDKKVKRSSIGRREKHLVNRRLMSIQTLDEYGDNCDTDLTFEGENDENGNVDSPNKQKKDLTDDQDILMNSWNKVIDKIIRENSSDLSDFGNTTGSPLKPDENQSVLKQLRFYSADQSIKNMAKNIVHNANIHESKEDKEAVVNAMRRSHRKRNKGIALKRKLMEYLDDQTVWDKLKFANAHSGSNNQALNVTSGRDPPPEREKDGRDFVISLTGKIHVEGGTDGQPISISFDASPDIQKPNESIQSLSRENIQVENNTKNAANTNFLSSLFNIADGPKAQAQNPLTYQSNSPSNVSLNHGSRSLKDKKLRPLREYRRKKYSHSPKNHNSQIRKSRAADSSISKRYRDDRVEDFEESKDSKYSDDHETYQDSEMKDENDVNYDDDQSSAFIVDKKSSESESNINELEAISNNPDAKVIKIIPLTVIQGPRAQDSKISRMTASQLPKNNDNMIGETMKPGKIEPADMPWEENQNENQQDFESINENSGSPCSSQSVEKKKPCLSDYQRPNERFTTPNPLNLRVVGLVSIGQPSMDNSKNFDDNSHGNNGAVPLVHIKIEQRPLESNRNCMKNRPKGCQKIEMTHSNNFPGHNALCPRVHEFSNKISNKIVTPACSGNRKIDNDSVKNSHHCENHRKPCPCSEESASRDQIRKTIKMKNMLAIMEFMKKIHKILGNAGTIVPNNDPKQHFIERITTLPKNFPTSFNDGQEEPDSTTRRVVMIGEGLHHDLPSDFPSKENIQPLDKSDLKNKFVQTNKNVPDDKDQDKNGWNDKFSQTNENVADDKDQENNSWSDKFSEMNENIADDNDQDQSFLFSGKSNKHAPSIYRFKALPNHSRLFARLNNNNSDTNTESMPGNISSTESTVMNISTNTLSSTTNASRNNETLETFKFREKNDTLLAEMMAKNEQQSREPKDDSPTNYREHNRRKMKKRFNNGYSGKRKTIEIKSSLSPKVKRCHSRKRLIPLFNGLRDEPYAEGRIYGKDSFEPDGQLARASIRNFGTLTSSNAASRVKRRKKKKRRRKKKRKKNKKGRSGVAEGGNGWWSFGRQLMSLNDGIIVESNVDKRNLESPKFKIRRSIRGASVSVQQRDKRRVHRVNYSHVKKKKNKKSRRKRSTVRKKRQINPDGTQTRGGQDCMDRRHPSDVNPVKYLESSHCLRFSDLWYSVYEMENPIMEHTVYLQLFEKHSLPDGTTHWDDLTQGTMVRVGTFTRRQMDKKTTIVFTYSGAKIQSQRKALNLDPSSQRLLVPSPVPSNKAAEYAHVRGPGEYLVVPTSAIATDGKECDKAGVSFAAFAKQDDRCGRAKGACLKNQPLTYWRHDMKARESGRPGCYFLSNFASVPTNPIKYNLSSTGSPEYLGLEYHAPHTSTIDIEVRADYNAIVRVGSSGRITQVYVDSTSPEHTVVTIIISNMGLASSPYQPRITDCPTGLPISWTKAKGIMQVISPQHDQRVTLDLYGQLLLNSFHCSVEVVNHRGELVAMRRVRVQKMDRCFCVWHCLCACIGGVSGLGCQPMSPEHYHAAGFQGPVPVITTETSILLNTIKNVAMISTLLVLLLLLLGLVKWLLGICSPSIGRWGLNSLLEGSKLDRYLEPELQCRCVVTDDDGAPVHPDTGQRTVRLCSRKLEFVLNLIFFLTYPIAVCCGYFRKSLQSSRQRDCCPDESKMCLITGKSSCPKMICVSTYGESRNSKLEAEDTRYVMNELKKSQESLRNKESKKKNRVSDNSLTRKPSRKNKSTSDINAKKLVDDLLKKRTVFRNLSEPIDGLAVPSGTVYSLRGYFLNAENGGYRFITPCPFQQLILWDAILYDVEKKIFNNTRVYHFWFH